MTPEQAIERGENRLKHNQCGRNPACGECYFCLESEALRIVLELAKRPYALGEGERKSLRRLRNYYRKELFGMAKDAAHYQRFVDNKSALTAALSLASPFTEKEAEALKAYVEFGEANELCLEDDPHGLLDDAPEAHELIAKLDAMLAQSSPANS